MSIFHNVENTFEKWEHNIIFFVKKELFVWNLFFGFFFWLFKKQNKFLFAFFLVCQML